MIIQLTRKINGRALVQELEKTYGSIDALEELYQENLDNLKLYTDLEDWKYFLENPQEVIEDGKTMVYSKEFLSELEIELLELIKNEKPQSINEIVQMTEHNIKTIYPIMMQLEEKELIELIQGPKKTMMPVLKYDEIEIKD